MLRIVAIACAVLLCLIGGVGVMLYLTYGLANDPPSEARLPELSDSTFISVAENGSATIRAESRRDAAAALGYLHAAEHGWTMTLLQRTARGQLSAWLGDNLLPLDRLTRRLGMAELARSAYAALPPDERALLEAYAHGATVALDDARLRRSAAFSILEVTPEPWEPWFPLAVDRLYAWISTDLPLADSLYNRSSDLRSFYAADSLLHGWLHLHGFGASLAWTSSDSSGTNLMQRHVHGATALPVFQEVDISYESGRTLAGATLIGTPFMPAGRSETHSWSILLSAPTELEEIPFDTTAGDTRYEKVEAANGREYVLEFRAAVGVLMFEPDEPAADAIVSPSDALPAVDASIDTTLSPAEPVPAVRSTWALRWSGLQPVSDAVAWLRLADDPTVPFQVHDGDGLVLWRDGTSTVLGDPLFVYSHRRGVAVGNSMWSRFAAERLDSIETSGNEPIALTDLTSAWAARLAPLLTEMAVSVPDQPALVADALAYLRNWDFAYDRASIAASIFDVWTKAYRDSLGSLPATSAPDSALGHNLVRYQLLVEAVSDLADRFGDDPSQWRWEEVQPHRYFFPVWSADTLLAPDLEPLASTRFAAITIPGSGHVSTLYHGPSSIEDAPSSPAQWSGWTSTSDWDAYYFRARRFDAERFFGRYLVPDRVASLSVMPAPGSPEYTVTLLPE